MAVLVETKSQCDGGPSIPGTDPASVCTFHFWSQRLILIKIHPHMQSKLCVYHLRFWHISWNLESFTAHCEFKLFVYNVELNEACVAMRLQSGWKCKVWGHWYCFYLPTFCFIPQLSHMHQTLLAGNIMFLLSYFLLCFISFFSEIFFCKHYFFFDNYMQTSVKLNIIWVKSLILCVLGIYLLLYKMHCGHFSFLNIIYFKL